MDPTTADIISRYGPGAAATVALLAALGRPGSVEGIVRWFGATVHAVGAWSGRLVDRVADAFIRRIDSTTRVNEALSIALGDEAEPGGPRSARTSQELRALTVSGARLGSSAEGGGEDDAEQAG